VDSSVDQAELSDSYLARIREAHPDFAVSPDHHVVRELNAAFTVLSNPDARRKYDQALSSDTCPWCGKPLPAYGLEQHVAEHEAGNAGQGCVVCGRLPAWRFKYQARTGMGLWRRKHQVDDNLCKTCSTGVFRAMQTRNLTRGPWSIVSFFTTPYISLKNWLAHRKTATMQGPKPAAPLYDEADGLGRKVFASPGPWLSLAATTALIVGATIALSSAVPSSEPPTMVLDVPTSTTVDPHDGWAAGVCARVDGAGRVFPIECGDHYAEVVAIAATADDCPDTSEWSLRLTEGVACFKYAFVREDS
jgi:hypothetical protein